ncbi:MAG: hypothetical protein HYS52_01270 [Candidatus Wildermuthbacteria bacterium]|nr:hypothetical protein [Candidatus Wildermuthbacteria bacterium]
MFLIPIFIILIVFAATYADDLFKGIDLSSFLKLNLSVQPSKSQAPVKTQQQQPSTTYRQGTQTRAPPPFILETFITKGTKEGEIILDTNRVTFEFSGTANPQQAQSTMYFETLLQGVDASWQSTSGNRRDITLVTGSKQYTFLVRSKIGDIVDETPAKVNFRIAISPYFQKIRISSFRPLSGLNPALATLRASFDQETAINITGWTLKSRWTGDFRIPYGIEKYHPIMNSFPAEPIAVKRSDTAYISSGKSPLGKGRNFRPNQCFGYLKSSFAASLPGPSSCSIDKPRVEQINHLSPICQEFILTKIDYGSCKLPDKGIPSNPDCVSYLTSLAEGFSYEGCYQKRNQEQNFLSSEWYVYVESDFGNIFHDTITLYDQTGLVVDTYIY